MSAVDAVAGTLLVVEVLTPSDFVVKLPHDVAAVVVTPLFVDWTLGSV